MKILKKFFLIIFFIAFFKCECGLGCFSCQKNDCFICNHFQNYYLDISQKKCIKKYIPNCQKMSDGHCLECKEKFIYKIDKNGEGECKMVDIIIENCKSYNYNSCKECKAGYYQYGIKCIAYKKKIDHCVNYYRTQKNDIKCNLCENGYLLSEDQNICKKYEKDKNCLIASNFYCSRCDLGFKIENKLFNDRERGPNLYEWVNDILAVNEEPYRQTSVMKCNSIVDNCKDYDTFEINEEKIVKCIDCFSGFYLKNITPQVSKCFKAQKIDNCDDYEDEGNCKFCQNGFFLEDKTCKKIEKIIKNCEVYESNDKCFKCNHDYKLIDEEKNKKISKDIIIFQNLLKSYLSQDNIENPEYRKGIKDQLFEMLKIDWVENLNLNFNLKALLVHYNPNERELREIEEQVEILADNNTKTQNFLKLLNDTGLEKPQCIKTETKNCKSYYDGECIECMNNFYLLETNCIKLKEEKIIINCTSYDSSQNCQNCKNGFILYNNLCFKMNPIHNCQEKIFEEEGQCLMCRSGYYYDHEINKCIPFKEMEEKNCLIFSDLESKNCYLCNKGYYMDNKENCVFQDDIRMDSYTGRLSNHRQRVLLL